ncbi:uncharacterized protein LOC120002061 [Tripterygium wilfordii]|uniref:uncharacterized protein LOC120002061 n=1 Tax=Tripterygium wilfordii TaxID=458696 RepID=UPI0018F801B5|nr:uncharacterized protein LOC120002061 [Tripterygium wilfordii]XP_038706558.1 uncharacterized protein LOC120002061 [Tripterygium wilfordii]XP_038706560.1 uncharacterized protein LOC120002061 [Tripterygium wilfordii]
MTHPNYYRLPSPALQIYLLSFHQPHSSISDLIEVSVRARDMCPLRLILIFLSATLAGFFVLRNLRSQQPLNVDDAIDSPNNRSDSSFNPPINGFSKTRSIVESGFWGFVDMATGRYLWRHLTSSSSPPKRSS